MDTSDTLDKILRYGLIAVFLGYYVVGWVLSARIGKSAIRKRILRWAFVPLVIIVAMWASCQYAKCARGATSVTAIITTVVIFMLGAVLFSIWLQRMGGRELLYVPIAFLRFGSEKSNEVTQAVVELSSGKPDFRRDFILSLLPALFAIMTICFIMWATSRPLGG